MRASEFITERKKKKSSRSTGGYFFPGYGYYASGDSGEGGGDGGGESMRESSDKKEAILRIQKMLNAKYNANLDLDGILGPLTRETINKFMPNARIGLADEPEKTTAVQGKKIKENFADAFLDSTDESVAEGLEYADKLSGLVDLPVFNSSTNPNPSGVAKVVYSGDRIMAVMNVRGVNVPYYISTGQGGKASVPTGKWYPVFGVHSSGWLNKGGEDSINKFYGSKLLALNAGRLNNALGDLSSVEEQIPLMKKTGFAIINKDLQPMGHAEVSANPDEFKKRVNAFLAKLGSEPFYQVNATQTQGMAENFADGRNPQDKGDAKRHGINTKASVSSLRKTAKQGGRKGQLAHWLANMKSGRAKKK